MASKYFEVRDCGTNIPVVAVQLDDSPIARRAGFLSAPYKHVIVTALASLKTYHCTGFIDGRTMRVACEYIGAHFDDLKEGAVIDVEFILGETKEPKVPECAQR
jgi:hypothetical protein